MRRAVQAGYSHGVTSKKMHAEEVETDASLVRRLLAGQFPQWAGLPVRPVRSVGTDNAVYRLGDDLAMRLPRIGWAVEDVSKDHHWLPWLAPRLPLPVPAPLALGVPGEGYPFPWAVYRWLPGVEATLETVRDPHELARDLAGFITALRAAGASELPRAAPGSSRAGTLAGRDEGTRAAIGACAGLLDVGAVTAAWEAALSVPAWDGPPALIHGDLKPGNLLAAGGRLSAVIDFGCLTLGDPAVDLLPAWNLLPAPARSTFREETGVDDASWVRGQGWALSVGLAALPYYRHTNPVPAGISRHQILQVLAESQRGAQIRPQFQPGVRRDV